MPALFSSTVFGPQPVFRRAARCIAVILLAGIMLSQISPSWARAAAQPWMDSSLPPEQRAGLLLGVMTVDEKIAMVHGDSPHGYVGRVPGNARLGIPELILQDGPAGAAGGLTSVTAFPDPITVAASWDVDLMQRYGAAMAEEERDKGVNVQLGPMMNMDRVPLAGRNFEGYGEDPYLAGQLAAAAVRGIQSRGVIATAKHFINNDQEFQRTTISAEIDLRTLHELYLPPFAAAVRAGVGAIMCSYNLIHGVYACENDETQNTLLKGELGFTGWIMSDWGATHSTADAANHGLDMEMPSGVFFTNLQAALNSGEVTTFRLNDMVLRILTVMFRMGLFDRAPVGSIGADVQSPVHTQLAQDAAAQSMVLLKNSNQVLPLDELKIHSIAVFGGTADTIPVIAGGGSAHVTPDQIVTPLQGIIARAGNSAVVRYFQETELAGNPIPAAFFKTPKGGQGLQAQYFNNSTLSGNPVLSRVDPNIDFSWDGGAPGNGVSNGDWSARWTGTITAPTAGLYNLALISHGGSRLYIDGQLVIDNWGDHAEQTKLLKRRLQTGKTYAITVEYAQAGETGDVHFTWFKPGDDTLAQAAAFASQSDVAIVVTGSGSGEGADQQGLDVLNDALVSAVAQGNSRTIVVVYSPAQVLMPWTDQVSAILLGWLPGQEAGGALASVLFGDVNPSGKLPMTFAQNEADYPANTPEQYPGVDGHVYYTEGLRMGYRYFDSAGIKPLFPFGYGLSYTTFDYANLTISPAGVSADGAVTISVDVTNSGARPGAEVAQLYLGFPMESSEPPSQLKGFQKVFLQPGETRRVTFQVAPQDFSFWSAGLNQWVAYPGSYQVMVGSSSRDIRESGTFNVSGGPLAGTVYQAEAAALWGGATVANNQALYTGTGFVGGYDQAGAAAAFTVHVDSAGAYNLTLRYASAMQLTGSDTPRSLSIYVNGARAAHTSLPSLANWDTWDFKTETLSLQAGDNTITYQYNSGDSGGVHLDAVLVEKYVKPAPTATATNCPIIVVTSTPAPATQEAATLTPAAPGSSGSALLPDVLLGVVILAVFAAVGIVLSRRRSRGG